MNNVEWVLARYANDLRRREFRNIGVILLTPEGSIHSRFLAVNPDMSVNETEAARIFKSVDNYKAWIAFWHYRMSFIQEKGLLEAFSFQGPSNFIIEAGGQRLVGNTKKDPEDILRDLFQTLVL